MSKDTVKHEINKVLDHFSDHALQEFLAFLKQLEAKHHPNLLNPDQLQRILSEDQELLERLAQ